MTSLLGLGFPGDSVVKNSLANAGDAGSVPGLGRSTEEGNDNPLQYSCLENPVDRGRSLAGYSPWGRKRVYMTERLTLPQDFSVEFTEQTQTARDKITQCYDGKRTSSGLKLFIPRIY